MQEPRNNINTLLARKLFPLAPPRLLPANRQVLGTLLSSPALRPHLRDMANNAFMGLTTLAASTILLCVPYLRGLGLTAIASGTASGALTLRAASFLKERASVLKDDLAPHVLADMGARHAASVPEAQGQDWRPWLTRGQDIRYLSDGTAVAVFAARAAKKPSPATPVPKGAPCPITQPQSLSAKRA